MIYTSHPLRWINWETNYLSSTGTRSPSWSEDNDLLVPFPKPPQILNINHWLKNSKEIVDNHAIFETASFRAIFQSGAISGMKKVFHVTKDHSYSSADQSIAILKVLVVISVSSLVRKHISNEEMITPPYKIIQREEIAKLVLLIFLKVSIVSCTTRIFAAFNYQFPKCFLCSESK